MLARALLECELCDSRGGFRPVVLELKRTTSSGGLPNASEADRLRDYKRRRPTYRKRGSGAKSVQRVLRDVLEKQMLTLSMETGRELIEVDDCARDCRVSDATVGATRARQIPSSAAEWRHLTDALRVRDMGYRQLASATGSGRGGDTTSRREPEASNDRRQRQRSRSASSSRRRHRESRERAHRRSGSRSRSRDRDARRSSRHSRRDVSRGRSRSRSRSPGRSRHRSRDDRSRRHGSRRRR